ncbi:MAG: hypothetical protein NT076_04305 [Candidatus Pacearchaeota archaeon]|nr:hypothetical protein [Candidatus Pacearchaeota archaeon]
MSKCDKCKKEISFWNTYNPSGTDLNLCKECYEQRESKGKQSENSQKMENKHLTEKSTGSGQNLGFWIGQLATLIVFIYAIFYFDFAPIAENVYQQQYLALRQIGWFLSAIFLEIGQITVLLINRIRK